jgi:hypothetical protein
LMPKLKFSIILSRALVETRLEQLIYP